MNKKSQQINIRNFAGGVWRKIQNNAAPSNSVALNLNMDSDSVLGSLVTRKGLRKFFYSTATLANSSVKGLFQHYGGGERDTFVVYDTGDLYRVKEGTPRSESLSDSGINGNVRTRFLTFLGRTIRFNGGYQFAIPRNPLEVTSGTPDIREFDGESWVEADSGRTATIETDTPCITTSFDYGGHFTGQIDDMSEAADLGDIRSFELYKGGFHYFLIGRNIYQFSYEMKYTGKFIYVGDHVGGTGRAGTGLTFDGTNFWVSSVFAAYEYSFNGSTGAYTGRKIDAVVNRKIYGIAHWRGAFLAVLHKIDGSGTNTVNYFYKDGSLVQSTGSNAETRVTSFSISSAVDVREISISGDKLYVIERGTNEENKISAYDVHGVKEKDWTIDGTAGTSLAMYALGDQVWIASLDEDGDIYEYYRLGNIIRRTDGQDFSMNGSSTYTISDTTDNNGQVSIKRSFGSKSASIIDTELIAEVATSTICQDDSSVRVSIEGHGLSVGDKVRFTTATELPEPIEERQVYHIIQKDNNSFQISEKEDGSAVTATIASPKSHILYEATTFGLESIPNLSVAIEWRDRIYGATNKEEDIGKLFYSSIADNNSKTVFWDIPDENDKTLALTTGGFISLEQNDGGGKITALAKVPGYLMIWKENTMHRWNGYNAFPDEELTQGVLTQEAVCVGKGTAYFLNKKGVWATNGGAPVRISRPIQDFIDALDDLNIENLCSYSDDVHAYWSVGTLTVQGETYKNVILKFNIEDQTWDIRTYPRPITQMTQWVDPENQTRRILIAGEAGDDIAFLNEGFMDGKKPIEWRVQLHPIDLGRRGRVKVLKYLTVLCYGGENTSLIYRGIKANRSRFSKWSKPFPCKHPVSSVEFINKDYNLIDIAVAGISRNETIFDGIEFDESGTEIADTRKALK